MKKLFISFLSLLPSLFTHLIICAAVIAVLAKWLVPAIPASAPYVIVFDVCFCLGIMSIWYTTNFDIDSWLIGAYLVIIVILLLIFLFSIFEWVAGFDLIPKPWRYIAVFESLFMVSMFVIFLVIIAAENNIGPAKNNQQRQPA